MSSGNKTAWKKTALNCTIAPRRRRAGFSPSVWSLIFLLISLFVSFFSSSFPPARNAALLEHITKRDAGKPPVLFLSESQAVPPSSFFFPLSINISKERDKKERQRRAPSFPIFPTPRSASLPSFLFFFCFSFPLFQKEPRLRSALSSSGDVAPSSAFRFLLTWESPPPCPLPFFFCRRRAWWRWATERTAFAAQVVPLLPYTDSSPPLYFFFLLFFFPLHRTAALSSMPTEHLERGQA